MRDELVGYLMGALDAPEMKRVKQRLAEDSQLQREADVLQRGIQPLEHDRQLYEPPSDLLRSTLAHVEARGKTVSLSPRRDLHGQSSRGRWSMADVVVAAGVCLAAVMLFFPAVIHSRHITRLNACKMNQQHLHQALAQYSSRNRDQLPFVSSQDTAGIYAPILNDAGLISKAALVHCPERNNKTAVPEIPSVQMVRNATGPQLAKIRRKMGGSYAYVLGYVDANGKLHPIKLRNRKHFALLADAIGQDGKLGAHGKGHNVTFEDGHIQLMKTSETESGDDIFRNDQGAVAAGLHSEDAVLGSSSTRPLPWKGIETSLTAPPRD